MTLQQMEYIVAVDDHGSFSKAAAKCCVTQPTLSMQIQKLEEELGVRLFDRGKQPIRCTPIGSKIVRQARDNVQGVGRINAIIHEQMDKIGGQLRIGIIPTLAPYLLPEFVTGFLRRHPSVNLTIDELISEQIVQKLERHALDVGILVTPLENKDLAEIRLFYEPFVAYVSTTHPLTDRDRIRMKDLKLKDMLLLTEGHCFRNQVVRICPNSTEKSESQLRFESGSLETLKRFIEKGYGFTLLPELAVRGLPKSKARYVKELSHPRPVREVSLVVHGSMIRRKVIEALKDLILKNIPKAMQTKKAEHVVGWR